MKTKIFIVILLLTTFMATGQAQVTIGSLGNPAGGALLDLKDREITSGDETSSTRGLLFPRVKLTNPKELYPMYSTDSDYERNKAKLKAEHIGLTVYNLNDKNGFGIGLHIWNGESWVKPVTELPVVGETSINSMFLSGSNIGGSPVVTKITNNDTPRGSGGGTVLYWKKSNTGNPQEIVIPENGAYFFNLSFYANQATGSCTYYVSLWANGSIKSNGTASSTLDGSTLKDITTLIAHNKNITRTSPTQVTVNSAFFYTTVTLGASFNAGDRVYIKIAYDPNQYIYKGSTSSFFPMELSIRSGFNTGSSTLTWWKL